MFLRMSFFLILTLLGQKPAVAENLPEAISVKCVQRNLELLGHNPRGVDGSVGAGTIAASVAFKSKEDIYDLPDLNVETAELWCRKMLEGFPEALTIPLVIITNGNVFEKTNVRLYGGREGIVPLVANAINVSATHRVADNKFVLDQAVPITFIEQASYLCVEGIGKTEIELSVHSHSSSNPEQIDGLTNTHPFFRGYCRWSEGGNVIARHPELVNVVANQLEVKLPTL